jgi:transposase-like protein
MSASHTATPATSKATASKKGQGRKPRLTIVPGIGLVDLDDPRVAGRLVERLAGKVGDQLVLFAQHMQEGLLAASVAIGLDVMAEFMEADVTTVAGPKGRHNPSRAAYRHGHEDAAVTLGGRRVAVSRPRVRGVEGGEVHLESYETFASTDLLTAQMVAAMMAGLSTRRYERALEPVGTEVAKKASSTSRSSVSRRFVAATAERLAEFRSRPLDNAKWLVIFVDGFDFAGHTMVGALGVTADGTKVPLGVVEGSTENSAVVRGLVSGLRDRGVDDSDGILFVLDGGKALTRAVKDVFGDKALIQRCRLHKERNVADHLPEVERLWVLAKMRQAWKNPDADEAERDLRELATQLEKINPDAAGSLREGLAEMFTVTRLGVRGTLLATVMSTNPVESMIEIVRAHSRNVKNWQPGDMRLRWAAAGMLEAAKQFRRVKGYSQLPQLASAIKNATSKTENSTVPVAPAA